MQCMQCMHACMMQTRNAGLQYRAVVPKLRAGREDSFRALSWAHMLLMGQTCRKLHRHGVGTACAHAGRHALGMQQASSSEGSCGRCTQQRVLSSAMLQPGLQRSAPAPMRPHFSYSPGCGAQHSCGMQGPKGGKNINFLRKGRDGYPGDQDGPKERKHCMHVYGADVHHGRCARHWLAPRSCIPLRCMHACRRVYI